MRVYHDVRFSLAEESDRSKIRAYGIKIDNDGSEVVLWHRDIFPGGLGSPREYEYFYDQKFTYIFFPRYSDRVIKLMREDGKIIEKINRNSATINKLKENNRWKIASILERPVEKFEHTRQSIKQNL